MPKGGAMPDWKWATEIIIEPDDNGFHGYCPALKGLHVDGDTEEETLKIIKLAIELYMDSIIRHNDKFPNGIISIIEL